MKHLLTTASFLAISTLPATAQEMFDLGEIVFSATSQQTQIGRTGVSIGVIVQDDLAASDNRPMSGVLTTIPGVSSNQNGPVGTSADLKIRGSSEKFIAVYFDGIKVNDPSATSGQFGGFGALTAAGIERAEVLKGSQSALYGASAVAGAVTLTGLPDSTTPGISQQVSAMVGSYGTVSSSYKLVQNTGPLTLRFGLSHLESDGFSSADEDNGNTEADAARETRGSFGAEYVLSDSITIGANGFASTGQAEFDEYADVQIDGTTDELGTSDTQGARVYAQVLAGGWTHDIALSTYQVDRTSESPTVSARTTANFGAPFSSHFKSDRQQLTYVVAGQISPQLHLTAGADLQRESATYANLSSGMEKTDTKGIFAETVFSPSGDLDITTTIRNEHHSSFGTVTTGRMSFSQRLGGDLLLRGSMGNGYRAPSIDELYGSYPSSNYVGNPNLDPETSFSYELGADATLADGSVLGATLFQTQIDNLITYQYVPFPANSTLANEAGISTRKGLEVQLNKPLGDALSIEGAYTYLDATNAAGSPARRTARHDIALALHADLSTSLSAAVSMNRIMGRADDGFPATAMPDYTVVNATIGYAISESTNAYLRIENLLDEDYQTSKGYGTSDRAAYFGIRANF